MLKYNCVKLLSDKNTKETFMNVEKVRAICRPFRIVLGASLIGYGVYSSNPWFYLGAIPLIAGLINFCPLCKITGQCDILGGK
jgi:hypothetical protein